MPLENQGLLNKRTPDKARLAFSVCTGDSQLVHTNDVTRKRGVGRTILLVSTPRNQEAEGRTFCVDSCSIVAQVVEPVKGLRSVFTVALAQRLRVRDLLEVSEVRLGFTLGRRPATSSGVVT